MSNNLTASIGGVGSAKLRPGIETCLFQAMEIIFLVWEIRVTDSVAGDDAKECTDAGRVTESNTQDTDTK